MQQPVFDDRPRQANRDGSDRRWIYTLHDQLHDRIGPLRREAPETLGIMASFAVGDLFTTKPSISGTPCIQKMSDSCSRCSFHPKRDCPIPALCGFFLARHERQWHGLQRMH
jgi:hypothetical protein